MFSSLGMRPLQHTVTNLQFLKRKLKASTSRVTAVTKSRLWSSVVRDVVCVCVAVQKLLRRGDQRTKKDPSIDLDNIPSGRALRASSLVDCPTRRHPDRSTAGTASLPAICFDSLGTFRAS